MRSYPYASTATPVVSQGRWRYRVTSLLAAFGFLIAAGYGACRYALEAIAPLSLRTAMETSVVALDRKGELLRAYTTSDGLWRLPVSINQVDPIYIKMLLAFEDRRYWSHSGVDPLAIARAGWQMLQEGRVVSGASTITMQVARLVARQHGRTLGGKLRQAVHAVHLERQLNKRAILSLYLRMAPFGGNLEGVRAASLAYFGKEPQRLSPAQAALLVALPQSPESRRPDRHRAAARQARNRVLDIAVSQGIISPETARRAKAERIPRRRIPFPLHAAHLVDAEVKHKPGRAVHHLTIDRGLQADLERLAKAAARRNGPKLTTAIVVVDHATGEVLARVGSAGYLDMGRTGGVDMTRAIRSPGSALKPFIYGVAFDRGIVHPETLIEDRPTRFGTYAPKNFGESFRGTVSIREALAASLNIPAVKVLEAVGPARLVAKLRGAGANLVLPGEAEPSLAVALGGLGLSLTDLTGLYAALARGGVPVPLVHSRLSSSNGHDAAQSETSRLLTAEGADAVTRILRTAPPPPNARGGEIAFKTGTSYGHRDAWAIGYDGRHVVGVWIGRADATATPDLVGRTSAAPILFDAFQRVSKKRVPFVKPKTPLERLSGTELPPPLRRFERLDAFAAHSPYLDPPVQIAFPPDRSEIAIDDRAPLVILRADGGALPLTWLADGVPINGPSQTRELAFRPDGQGFVKLVVMDAHGRTDRVTVRLSKD
ncbi:MAG: penicillin-binding protein 1C [Pseudomonadota bacterium]